MEEFLEIKRHLNKPDEQYRCRLIRKEPGHVVLQYVSDRPFASERLGVTFPPGCVTIASYWADRPYVFWAIYSPAGENLGYLVHVCRDMSFYERKLEYLDMLLDIWFYPDGRFIILDEDEVEESLQAGRLQEQDIAYIESAKDAALRDYAENAAESAAIADMLDISGGSP